MIVGLLCVLALAGSNASQGPLAPAGLVAIQASDSWRPHATHLRVDLSLSSDLGVEALGALRLDSTAREGEGYSAVFDLTTGLHTPRNRRARLPIHRRLHMAAEGLRWQRSFLSGDSTRPLFQAVPSGSYTLSVVVSCRTRSGEHTLLHAVSRTPVVIRNSEHR